MAQVAQRGPTAKLSGWSLERSSGWRARSSPTTGPCALSCITIRCMVWKICLRRRRAAGPAVARRQRLFARRNFSRLFSRRANSAAPSRCRAAAARAYPASQVGSARNHPSGRAARLPAGRTIRPGRRCSRSPCSRAIPIVKSSRTLADHSVAGGEKRAGLRRYAPTSRKASAETKPWRPGAIAFSARRSASKSTAK